MLLIVRLIKPSQISFILHPPQRSTLFSNWWSHKLEIKIQPEVMSVSKFACGKCHKFFNMLSSYFCVLKWALFCPLLSPRLILKLKLWTILLGASRSRLPCHNPFERLTPRFLGSLWRTRPEKIRFDSKRLLHSMSPEILLLFFQSSSITFDFHEADESGAFKFSKMIC